MTLRWHASCPRLSKDAANSRAFWKPLKLINSSRLWYLSHTLSPKVQVPCWAWDSSSPACRRTRRPPRPSTLKHVAPWCRIYIDLVVSQSHCIARSFETLTPWAVVPRTQLQEPVEPIWRHCCIWLWHQIKEQSCGVETRTRQEDKHLCQCRLCCILWRLWSCPRNPSHHWPRGRPRWASIFNSSNGAQSIASKSWWSRNLFHSEDSPWPSNLWAKCFSDSTSWLFSDFDFLRCRQRGEHSHGSESFCQRHRTWGSERMGCHQGTLSRFLTGLTERSAWTIVSMLPTRNSPFIAAKLWMSTQHNSHRIWKLWNSESITFYHHVSPFLS